MHAALGFVRFNACSSLCAAKVNFRRFADPLYFGNCLVSFRSVFNMHDVSAIDSTPKIFVCAKYNSRPGV